MPVGDCLTLLMLFLEGRPGHCGPNMVDDILQTQQRHPVQMGSSQQDGSHEPAYLDLHLTSVNPIQTSLTGLPACSSPPPPDLIKACFHGSEGQATGQSYFGVCSYLKIKTSRVSVGYQDGMKVVTSSLHSKNSKLHISAHFLQHPRVYVPFLIHCIWYLVSLEISHFSDGSKTISTFMFLVMLSIY